VEHTALTEASVDELLDMLDHSGEFNDRLLAIVPNDLEPDVGMVRFNGDSLEINDLFGFQPRDTTRRLQSLTLQLEAA